MPDTRPPDQERLDQLDAQIADARRRAVDDHLIDDPDHQESTFWEPKGDPVPDEELDDDD